MDATNIGTPEPRFFPFGIDSVKQNLFLAPDQKMVRPKKVANDHKINLASYNFFGLFIVKKNDIYCRPQK